MTDVVPKTDFQSFHVFFKCNVFTYICKLTLVNRICKGFI